MALHDDAGRRRPASRARVVRPTMFLPPPGGVMLERVLMLSAAALIAFGIVTAFL